MAIVVLILLPTEYNPDKKGGRSSVPMKYFTDTVTEIEELFRLGCTLDPYPKHGFWKKSGIVFEDVNVIMALL